jgi:hypothetical protein
MRYHWVESVGRLVDVVDEVGTAVVVLVDVVVFAGIVVVGCDVVVVLLVAVAVSSVVLVVEGAKHARSSVALHRAITPWRHRGGVGLPNAPQCFAAQRQARAHRFGDGAAWTVAPRTRSPRIRYRMAAPCCAQS